MPYIDPEARRRLREDRKSNTIDTAGELNYAISVLCDEHLMLKGCSYATINELIGVLECAKLELYRRVAAPYEDKKKTENGDVYFYGG